MFFIFLFFGIFFTLVLIGIQSIDRKQSVIHRRFGQYDPRVTENDLKAGNVDEAGVVEIIGAMQRVADGPFYSNDILGRLNSIAFDLSDVEARLKRLELQRTVFLLMLSSLALIFGVLAASVAFLGFMGGIS